MDLTSGPPRNRILLPSLAICTLPVLGFQLTLPHGQGLLALLWADRVAVLFAGGLLAAIVAGLIAAGSRRRKPRTARPGRCAAAVLVVLGVLLLAALSAPVLAGRALVAGLAALVLLACCGFGCRLLGWIVPPAARRLPAGETVALAAGLGLGALALGTFLLGSAGILSRGPMLVLLLILAAVGRQQALALSGRTLRALRRIVRRRDPLAAGAMVLLAALTLLRLLAAFQPPADYDVLEYHLALPAEYLRLGRVAFLPHNMFSGFPQNAEMLALWPLAVVSDPLSAFALAKCLNVLIGLVAAAGTWGLASRLTGRQVQGLKTLDSGLRIPDSRPWAGACAALCVYGMVWTSVLSLKAYVELLQGLYAVAAVIALTSALRTADSRTRLRWFLLAGALAGLGGGVKYPALLFVAVPVGALAMAALWHAEGTRRALATGGMFLAGATVAIAPYLVRNLGATGNPTYPMLYGVFGGSQWSPRQAARLGESLRPRAGAGAALRDVFFRPQAPPGRWASGLRTTPLLAIFLPLGLLGLLSVRSRRSRIVTREWMRWVTPAVFAFHLLTWLWLTHRVERFLYPGYGILAAGLASGLARWRSEALRHAVSVTIALALLLTGPLLVRVSLWAGPRALSGGEEPRAVLRRTLGSIYWGMEEINALPAGSKVVLFGEARTLYLTTPHVYATVFDRQPLVEALRESAGAAAEMLRQRGVTHLYVHWGEVQRLETTYRYPFEGRQVGGLGLTAGAWQNFRDLLKKNAALVVEGGRRAGPDFSAPASENLAWGRNWRRRLNPSPAARCRLVQLYRLRPEEP